MSESGKDPIQDNIHTVEQHRAEQIDGKRQSQPTLFTCPECNGTLWQVADPEMLVFRCHVGHVLAAEKLFQMQAEAAENSLWTAIRTLTDRMVLGRQLAERARKDGEEAEANRFEKLAHAAEQQAETLQHIAESSTTSDR